MSELNPTISGVFEPSAQAQFLPRCTSCGHKHPLAYMPPLPGDRCPSCGAYTPPPDAPIDIPVVVASHRIRFGNMLMRIGRFFHRLSERL